MVLSAQSNERDVVDRMRGLELANYVLALPGIVFALTIHEYFKASISYRLGDPYPKLHGRLHFKYRSHFEPIGFLLMLLYGYGWGKPVITSDTYYKDKKSGALITYAAPIFINMLFAFTFFIILLAVKQLSYTLGCSLPLGSQGFIQSIRTVGGLGYGIGNIFSAQPAIIILTGVLYQIIYLFVRCNLSVALINLIPIYPLDGAALLENYLPPEYRYKFGQYKGILLPVLLLLFIFGFVNALLDPVILFLLKAVQ